MKKILKTSLLLGSLVVSSLLVNGQGMGGGALVEKPNCRPTTIIGEHNPTPGELYRYTHDYETANGEQFTWEVDGALEVDGVITGADRKALVSKDGDGIDVIWDGEHPTGRIKVTPATDCVERARDGGIGGVIVLNKGACDEPDLDAITDGGDNPCAGETHTYKFNYESKDVNSGGDGCKDFVWKFKGISQITLHGWFGAFPNTPNCGDQNYLYEEQIRVIDDPSIVTTFTASDFGELDYTICGTTNEATMPEAKFDNYVDVVFANGVDEASIEVSASSCGVPLPWCRTKSDKLDFNLGIKEITGISGASNIACGTNGLQYSINGGNGGTKTLTCSNPNWTIIYNGFPLYGYTINTNNSGSGTLIATSSNSCETETFSKTITVGENNISDAPSSIYSSGGTTLCSNQTLNFTAIGGSPTNVQHQWELRKGVVVKQGLIDGLSISPILGDIDNVRVRFVADCGYGPWTQLNLNVTRAPEPIENIIFTGSMCANEEYTIEALYGNSTHEGYQWNVDYSGSTTPIDPNTQNYIISGTVPPDANGSSVIVSVSASNSCGSTPIVTKTFTNGANNVGIFINEIEIPTKYCGGTSNTFSVAPQANNAEYEWEFYIDEFFRESVTGFEMYTYNPDFGEDNTSNHYPLPGTVENYEVRVRARSGCGGWSPFISTGVIDNVVYNGCNNGGGSAFSIKLLPNPAQGHVNVKFPNGGGSKNIKITDAYGVERKNVNTISASEMIDISDLPLGVYNVIATDGIDVDMKHLQVLP